MKSMNQYLDKMKKMEKIVVDKIDTALLKEQRNTLLVIAANTEICGLKPKAVESIQGLINLLDNMLDNSSDNPNREVFEILLIPSSEAEKEFEEIGDFNKAVEYADENGEDIFSDIQTFNSEHERTLFIRGYAFGIGWHGQGLYYTND